MSIISHLDLLSAIQPGGRSDIGRELPLPAAIFCEGGLLETHHTANPSTVQPGVQNQEPYIRNPITLGDSVVELLKIYKNSWVCHESSSQLL